MGDKESRMEDARMEAAIDRAMERGEMGLCECGDVTRYVYEDPDTGSREEWMCRKCQQNKKEESV